MSWVKEKFGRRLGRNLQGWDMPRLHKLREKAQGIIQEVEMDHD